MLFSCDSVCWAWARLSLYACTIRGSSCTVSTYRQWHARNKVKNVSKIEKSMEEDENQNILILCLYFATEINIITISKMMVITTIAINTFNIILKIIYIGYSMN